MTRSYNSALEIYDDPDHQDDFGTTHQDYDSPQSEVDAIVRKYGATTTITDTVLQIVKSPGYLDLFNEVFEHHISLLKSRSQAFEDGHITVYDKALLVLTNYGDNLHNMGAIELFKDEILGIRKKEDVGNLNTLFSKNIALRAILSFTTDQKKNDELIGSIPKEPAAMRHPVSAQGTLEPSNNQDSSNDLVAGMLKTFTKAHREYSSVRSSDHQLKYKAAKFLRDSAENTYRYLLENDPGHHMVPNLKDVFDMAQAKTLEMNGGIKRPFESSDGEQGMTTYARRRYRDRSGERPRHRGDCYRP